MRGYLVLAILIGCLLIVKEYFGVSHRFFLNFLDLIFLLVCLILKNIHNLAVLGQQPQSWLRLFLKEPWILEIVLILYSIDNEGRLFRCWGRHTFFHCRGLAAEAGDLNLRRSLLLLLHRTWVYIQWNCRCSKIILQLIVKVLSVRVILLIRRHTVDMQFIITVYFLIVRWKHFETFQNNWILTA